MAQTKSAKVTEVDVLIIGAGLAGLSALQTLRTRAPHLRIAMVEAADFLGGTSRSAHTAVGEIDYGLKIFPDQPSTHTTLDFLESLLQQRIERERIEAAPVTYDDGKFKPYVGFGDASVETATEIEAYAQTARLHLSSTPREWIQKLIQNSGELVQTQNVVTRLHTEDGRVTEVILNGAKALRAENIIYTAAPAALPVLIGEGNLASRTRQKLIKGEFWTSVNLDLVHAEPITDSLAMHVLKGANEEPCVGFFAPPRSSEDGRRLQLSQWMTLIHRDQVDEEELVAGALKQIKRQIKRAYESALENIVQERILVLPGSHGNLVGAFDEASRLPKLANLWITSALYAPEKNTVGCLAQVLRVTDSLLASSSLAETAGTEARAEAETV
jgi:protoporphyrinogen oxidase